MLVKRLFIFLFLLFFCIGIFYLIFPQTYAQAIVQTPKKGVGGQVGTGMHSVDPTAWALSQLGVSWYYNWSITIVGFETAERACVEFVPMVAYKPSTNFRRDEIEGIINRGYKGIYWLIGNEPDGTNSPDSDGDRGASQEELLNAYTQYAKIIKAADPTAKLIFGGFISVREFAAEPPKTPVALNFARILKDSLLANGITPKGWHIHQYHYPWGCCDVQKFGTILSGWLDWQNRVLGGGETWVTEFGPLQSGGGDAGYYMIQTINFMETTRLVDRYAWFALTAGAYMLAWPPGWRREGLTGAGRLYANLPDQGIWPTPTPCVGGGGSNSELGNLNCDSCSLINAIDLRILLGSWSPHGPAPTPPSGQYTADLTGNNKVNEVDLSILLGNWSTP